MGKILGSWSGMRKYLEQEMLVDCLKGRIRYNCTTYVGMDGCHIFEIYIDNQLSKQFSLETVNSYFIQCGYKQVAKPVGIGEYWNDFWSILENISIQERTEYTDNEFCEALETYRNQKIQDSIYSSNPLVRMFAIFDRRVGKRTLRQLEETIKQHPQWLKAYYRLRLEEENIRCGENKDDSF